LNALNLCGVVCGACLLSAADRTDAATVSHGSKSALPEDAIYKDPASYFAEMRRKSNELAEAISMLNESHLNDAGERLRTVAMQILELCEARSRSLWYVFKDESSGCWDLFIYSVEREKQL
jgi:hypothetical protein